MADQLRWFKVWTSLAVDMDHVSNEVIGAWTRLGCRAALVGTHGVVTFRSWGHLARFWNVTERRAHELVKMFATVLPTVHFEEGKTVNGTLTVTFENWTRYQLDSTIAERVKRLRSKRRGEEIRGDKTRGEESATTFVGEVGYSMLENGRGPHPAAISGGSDALERKPGTPVPKPASRRRRRYSAGRVLPTIPAWVRPVFEAWELAYRERFGKPPGEPKPWDIASAEVLVEKYGVDDVVAIVTRGIRTGPRCLRDRHKWGLQAIEDSWDTLVSLKASGQLL